MVRIRLTRLGRKNRPFFRIGIFESTTRRDGNCIEKLGTYDPLATDAGHKVLVNRERVTFWLKRGAQPTDKVSALFKHAGVL